MKAKHLAAWMVLLVSALAGSAWAQDTTDTVTDAFNIARPVVAPDLQTKVVSIYGIGTPSTIEKWYIIFYDPSVPSHGRAVLVENGQVVKTYPANGGVTYSAELTYDPAHITSEGPALNAAQRYAARHGIEYDSVHALLKRLSLNKPFRWRVELLTGGVSRGYVYINAVDDSVAYYEKPSDAAHGAGGSSDDSIAGFGNDVKKTFLGIGGDLQEFFTGERTVDK